jgi:hypothetical protein
MLDRLPDLFRLLLHPTEVVLLAATLAVLLRVPLSRWLAWGGAVLGGVVFLLGLAVLLTADDHQGNDTRTFRQAGVAVLEGRDPYQDGMFVNPPTALPVYVLFALVPAAVLVPLWTVLNGLGYLLVVWPTQGTLRSLSEDTHWLPAPVLALLGSTIALGFSCRYGLELGQMSLFMTLVLLAALYAQGKGRPILAGFFLTLGTAKTATLIPFLLLFLRKRDVRTWAALVGFSLLFCLLTNPPWTLLDRCRECLNSIGRMSAEGGFNDYSFRNPSHAEVISLEHAFYCVGLRDRRLIGALQFGFLILIGAGLAVLILRDRTLSRPAAISLVACYSCFFLYHRCYDLVILVIPLVHAAAGALRERGWPRVLFPAAVAGVLGLFYFQVGILRALTERPEAQRPGAVVQAVVLPYATWLLLGVMVCLILAHRTRRPTTVPA